MALKVFGVVVICGPRQVGKSTLVQQPAITGERLYLTLDDPDLLGEARRRPDRLLERAARVTIDEVQRAPELLLAIKRAIDRERRAGRFLITGSADILAMKQVADHLAGRAIYLHLEPLTASERASSAGQPGLDHALSGKPATEVRETLSGLKERPIDLEDLVMGGGFPEPSLMPDQGHRNLWFAAYIRTWLERGVTDLARISETPDLARLMRIATARLGGLLNQAEIARDVGLPRTTVHRYLNLLTLAFLLDPLPAYGRNLGTRAIKSPKLYWRDVGLAAHLSGVRARSALREHASWGALIENLVLANLRGWASAQAEPPEIGYWRTAGGREVDFIVEFADRIVPIEVKSGRRVRQDDLRHLEVFLDNSPDSPYGLVIHGGDTIETPTSRIISVPISVVLQ